MPDCAKASEMDKNGDRTDKKGEKPSTPSRDSKKKNATDGAIDVKGAASGGGGGRHRYDSEGAASNEDSSEQGKRQKTNQGFLLPGVASSSPPKFVSLEEIMTAASGMNNMALAHEIAVDKDFKLQKLEPPENSIHKQVKDTIHRAFWDLLSAELNEKPPKYTQAMVLLGDVKESLMSLLLPQHTKLKEQISEVLDSDLIRQQAEKGTLDFQHYAQYVISVMGKLCAPVRDEKIRELTQTQGVVPMFRGILETLDLMKLDMANFTIDLIRPEIVAKSVEYEKEKFAEFLKIQADGLQHTRAWLLRTIANMKEKESFPNVEDKNALRVFITHVIGEAYLELLQWDNDNPYPETLLIDLGRFSDLSVKFWRLSVIGSIMLVASSSALALQGVADFKTKLKEHITVLLEDTYTDKDLAEIIPNVTEQVVKEVAEGLKTYGLKPMEDSTVKVLKGQILEIVKEDHKIRQLVRLRVREFIQQSVTSPTAAPLRIPPGLSSLQSELAAITGQFLRLVSHNRAVFGEYYTDIITVGLASQTNAH